MSTLTPRYFIEGLREYNPAVIWASFFINPAIALMDSYRLKPFPCAVAYENVFSAMLEQTEGEMGVEFDWLAETFPDCQRLFQTLQRESIVEYAAVATAFLIMTNLAQKNISEVTLRGGKADYYVDGRKYLLEISGTESAEHLASRHSEKVTSIAGQSVREGRLCFCLLLFQSEGKALFPSV